MPDQPAVSIQRLEVSIEKMVYGGEGLARTADGVLLVPGLLPGERAWVEAEPPRRGVRRGQLLELIQSSPDRVVPECPYFGRCGGCQHQHISYARQLQLKQEILRECLERIGKLRLEVPITAVASEPWHYRNRISLRVEKAASFRAGYLQASSHEICPVDACPIASPALQEVIGELSSGTLAPCFPDGVAELELFASDEDHSLWATVCSSQPAPTGFGNAWREALPQFASVCWSQTSPGREASPGMDLVVGSGAITYRVGEYRYRVSHHSFFQTNRFLLQPMIDAALANLAGARALDLYAGVGLFTVPLARRFERVVAVEAHPAAAQDLAANGNAAGARVSAYHKTAESFLESTSHNWDLILVDPPRTGLSKPVREHLIRLRTPRLVYVSCDPTTLARDVAALAASGYRLASIHLLDLFPQTFHLETVAHLSRIE
jgi:23S rRNA (uracil1939-C5)-methyltransferase